jgi:predicted MPP superfamily phosphohydrolase
MSEVIKVRKISRRRFLRLALYGLPGAVAGHSLGIEPEWLKVRSLKLSPDPRHRIAHFTDIHHKGDVAYLERVVKTVNDLKADFACFTGDLVEEARFVPEALSVLEKIKVPLFGIPGNHDYWADVDFSLIAKSFERTGGQWLMDESVVPAGTSLQIHGVTCGKSPRFEQLPGHRQLLLCHYPAWVGKLTNFRFDLMLAGHSHGGQVRIPGYGPLITPSHVGDFDLGLYQTPSGPLYVNPGIGYFYLKMRFCCRPEVTILAV